MKRQFPKQLKAKIDTVRKEYVRKRDYDWRGYGKCISCEAVGDFMDSGHYYSRRHDWTTELGGDERNVNLQCVPCNHYKRGNSQGYALGLTRKHGEGILEELQRKYRTPKYWGLKALQTLLEEYQSKVKSILNLYN